MDSTPAPFIRNGIPYFNLGESIVRYSDGSMRFNNLEIPRVKVAQTFDPDKVWVNFNGRFGYPFSSPDDVSQALSLLAYSMAVLAGYSSFHPDSHRISPKFTQWVKLQEVVEQNETEVLTELFVDSRDEENSRIRDDATFDFIS